MNVNLCNITRLQKPRTYVILIAMSKTIKNFFWPINDLKTLKTVELFIKLSVVKGVPWAVLLAQVVDEWNKTFIKEKKLNGVKLVYEDNLLSLLNTNGVPLSRRTLYLHRNGKAMVRNGGKPLFWTDGRRVVYDLSGCESYFKYRRRTAVA